MRRLLASLALFACPPAFAQYANTADCLTPAEADLADHVNDYRQEQGLSRLPISFSLSSVGQWHVWDLEVNDPWNDPCNLHSWSNARPSIWQAMCYTSDHAQAAQMWAKPRQITDDAYGADGYENSYWNSGGVMPASALNAWKNSPSHNQLILNQGIWAGQTWRALGIGMSEHFAVLWFGALTDPLGTMAPCGTGGGGEPLFEDGFEG